MQSNRIAGAFPVEKLPKLQRHLAEESDEELVRVFDQLHPQGKCALSRLNHDEKIAVMRFAKWRVANSSHQVEPPQEFGPAVTAIRRLAREDNSIPEEEHDTVAEYLMLRDALSFGIDHAVAKYKDYLQTRN